LNAIDKPSTQKAHPNRPAYEESYSTEVAPAKRPVDPLLNHEYDGIREYDNPTPGWWHLLFIVTIIFSVFYIAWYSLSPVALSLEEKWDARQTLENKKIFGKMGELAGDEQTIVGLMADERLMRVATGMFVSNCAACHARDGGGINGVNLTDDFYKNTKTITDLLAVINTGANQGAMPAWKDKLSNNERVLLAAYVASLRGTTPGSAKAPEGEKIAPWPKRAEGSSGAGKPTSEAASTTTPTKNG
jgi:cytochrome c oxidase cbb3-type subunit III